MSKEACRMMISTKGRYALRVMLDMAEHGGGEWHRLSDVAQRQQLSKKYLESIMAALSARAANDLNFNDIVGSPSILFPSTER